MDIKIRNCLMAGWWVLWFIPEAALAHKVNLFAYADAGKIYSESYFSDGRSVAGGKVTVYDSLERLVLEGATDKQGLFSFDIPKTDDLTLVLDAGMGHKNRFVLGKAEMTAFRSEPERPGVREVLAGIGCILGLFGTAALIASRRRR